MCILLIEDLESRDQRYDDCNNDPYAVEVKGNTAIVFQRDSLHSYLFVHRS